MSRFLILPQVGFRFNLSLRVMLVFYLLFLCKIQDLMAQKDGQNESHNVSQLRIGDARLLNPPINDGPVVVNAAFHLRDIDEINDETETFQFVGFLSLIWQDSRQAFDPKDAGVDEKVFQGNFQFDELSPAWYPQIDLVNNYGIFEKRSILLRVKSDGTCILIESLNAAAKTRLDLTRYPFDNQNLKAYFRVLGFNNKEVIFKTDSSSLTWDQKTIRVPQWELKSVSSSVQNITAPYPGTNDASSAFVISLDVKRESLFMMRLVVIPLALIAILSWSVFWMDRSSLGDRMSVSFVGILTAVTYQIVVSEILPSISEMTMIHAFLNISFFMMCFTVVINLIVGAYDRRSESNKGNTLDQQCRWAFPAGYAVLNLLNWLIFY